MRILYVQQHFATGAGQAGVRGYNLVRTLVDRGHDVTVICGHNWRDPNLALTEGRWVSEERFEGFCLVKLGVFYSNHQSFAARVGSFLAFALLSSVEVNRRSADLVFASSTPLTVSVPALAARWLRGTPYAFEVRDLWPDLPIAMGMVRNPVLKATLYAWEKLAYRQAAKLVALAPGIKSGIVRAGVPPERVAMIPNGSDTERLQPLPRGERVHIPVGREVFLLGYTGTHGTANGLEAVLDAAVVLKHRGVTDVAFALVGDGREKARLVARADREGLDNVHFLGLVGKDLYNEVLCELDVGMQILLNVPEFYYGTSPNKFFDYLAVGRPILVNYPGWMSDLVLENKCGVAVRPDDAEAFADAVLELRDKVDRLPAMGLAGRRLAEERFSQAKILPQLVRFLEEEAWAPDISFDSAALA
jgi:glycosyltransferase involved in cell wall biosynthesis